jgi:hypothetical protein
MTDTQPLTDELVTMVLHQVSLTKYRPLQPDERDWLRLTLERTFAEMRRLRAISTAAYGFADEMGDYCSPHGVAADYAQRLRERLNDAKEK